MAEAQIQQRETARRILWDWKGAELLPMPLLDELVDRISAALSRVSASVAPTVDDKLIADIVEAVNRSKSINSDGEWWLDVLRAKARVRKLLLNSHPAPTASVNTEDLWEIVNKWRSERDLLGTRPAVTEDYGVLITAIAERHFATEKRSSAPASTVAPQKSLLRDPVRVEAVSPLVVTRDGVPCPDQAAALEEFKQACLASKYSEREREDAELGVKPDPTVAPQEQSDDGWVTFGRVKVDIDNETETFERIHPPVTPASPADIRDEAPTFKNTKEAMLYAQRHRMPAVIPATPPSRRAKAAAEEIGAWIFMLEQPLTSETDLRVATDHVESIILKRCFSTEGEDTK